MKAAVETAGNDIRNFRIADHLVHRAKVDDLIGVSARYNCVSRCVRISKRLGSAVASGILIGDDNRLNALLFDLLAANPRRSLPVL